MTWAVSVPVDGADGGGEHFTVATEEDVDRLVALLRRPEAGEGSIQSENGASVLDVLVQNDYGYLLFSGEEAYVYSVGHPDSPAGESEGGFPAGSGVSIDRFRAALVEFVTSGGRLPSAVEWRDS
ncbi:Immunity protein Imm1 [Amycolatopsis arida]|uniref:Immunity protein Imm1 n=1 Tax=Amycolatopsis arida TaxID=587909 RepID=A0A1I6ASY7_9PSEU|nr:Imm1 family immunity protein [Amycolatopsis arida]TDX97543.1 immunity protein Imm1 of predicted polymorphic toxin system [Amycolatopsis arida]SFQ71776.1 Immunity protein Imm1 [Amycolatopsis arida]